MSPPPKVAKLWSLRLPTLTLHDKKDSADVINVKDLEMRRLFRIIQVGPTYSHSLQKETSSRRNAATLILAQWDLRWTFSQQL